MSACGWEVGSTCKGGSVSLISLYVICQLMVNGFGAQPSPPGWAWPHAAWPQLLVVLECVWGGAIGPRGWYV
jgi:hypothetical protein